MAERKEEIRIRTKIKEDFSFMSLYVHFDPQKKNLLSLSLALSLSLSLSLFDIYIIGGRWFLNINPYPTK